MSLNKAEIIEFAKIELAMRRVLESGQTKLSQSGKSLIFTHPTCGRHDLSSQIETARAQMQQAGIAYQDIADHEPFGVSESDWESLAKNPNLQAYRIVTKGRKWLEAVHIFGTATVQIEINEASRQWEPGQAYVFAGQAQRTSTRYGTKVQIFPDCEESRKRLAEQQATVKKAKDAKDIERWLGYVEEKAKTGYWYKKGVETLRGYGVCLGGQGEAATRLNAAHTLFEQTRKVAEKQRVKEKAWRLAHQWLGYIRDNIQNGKGWYDKGENVVHEQIAVLDGQGEDVSAIISKLQELRQELARQQTGGYEGQTYGLGGGSGYGCRGWNQGEVVRNSPGKVAQGEPEFLFVLSASKRYVDGDGLSFGVGDEEGYLFSAICRAATPEESAPLVAEEDRQQKRRQARQRLEEIKKQIQETGELPAGVNTPQGEILFDTQNIYGGGDWLVIGPEWVWYVRNNGGDGDAWDSNNVRTGGAGAIGWRVAFNKDLATELEDLQQQLS